MNVAVFGVWDMLFKFHFERLVFFTKKTLTSCMLNKAPNCDFIFVPEVVNKGLEKTTCGLRHSPLKNCRGVPNRRKILKISSGSERHATTNTKLGTFSFIERNNGVNVTLIYTLIFGGWGRWGTKFCPLDLICL